MRPYGLNIGSGYLAQLPALASIAENAMCWIHLDRHERVHIQADARALPFSAETFDVVWCSHLIEHIPLDAVPGFLADIRRVLAPNGYLYVAAPDVARATAAGSAQWETYGREGGIYNEGWAHEWSCDAALLRSLLADAGLLPCWCKPGANTITGYPVKSHGWPDDFEARYVAKRTDSPWPRYYAEPIRTHIIFA